MLDSNPITHHLNYPDISVAQHRKAQRKALFNSIKDKKAIYLDTNYWVYFKDYVLGRKSEPIFSDLLERCTSMADSGRFFFPVSQSFVEEALTQSDNESRYKTGEIVDRLSGGVSLETITERFRTEVVNYFDQSQAQNLPYSSVWTKASMALGTADMADDPRLDVKTNLACKKAFEDHRWNQSFTDFLVDAERHNIEQVDVSAVYQHLNGIKKEHANDGEKFNDMVVIEVQMALEAYRPHLPEIVKRICEKNGIALTKVTEEHTAKIFNMVCEAFHQKKCVGRIPTLEIMGKLVSAVRWNSYQKFKKNDFRDYEHATGALPYCDLMLTEDGLTHLCNQKLVKLSKIYDCVVVSNPEDALQALNTLSL